MEKFDYLIMIGIVFGVATFLVFLIRRMMNGVVHKYAAKLKTDPTNFNFLKNSLSFIIYTVAIVFVFTKVPFLKSLGGAMFAGAGVLAAIIGFASQKAFSNIIAGIFILIFKPFRIGDMLEIGSSQTGIVTEITLRHTVITDFQNRSIIIPNNIISDESLINSDYDDDRQRKHITVGISYDSDIDKAMHIMRDECENHPLSIDARTEEQIAKGQPKVIVRVVELAESAVLLKAFVWAVNRDDSVVMYCDLLKSIKQRMDREGVEIPFPHRTIVYKTDILNQLQSQTATI